MNVADENVRGDPSVDLSAIVIGRDVAEEVLECLTSVATHAGGLQVELIYVDNGSSDGSPADVADAFPRARIITLERNRAGAARNEGLRVALGRHLLFLDSDARLTAGALVEMVRFLDAHAEVGLVGPKLVYPDGRLQLSARRFPPVRLPAMRRPPLDRFFEDSGTVRRHLMADERHDGSREVEYVISACVLFTARAKELAGEVGDFFPAEDIDWCMKIRAAGLKIAYHPTAVVIHDYRRTTARLPLSRSAYRHLRNFVRVQWKWRRLGRHLIAAGRDIDRREGKL